MSESKSQPPQPPQPQTKEELQEWIKEYCDGVKNHGEPNTWDVTRVVDMSRLFMNTPFNAPIDQWDTSNVTNMSSMFEGAAAFNSGNTPLMSTVSVYRASEAARAAAEAEAAEAEAKAATAKAATLL